MANSIVHESEADTVSVPVLGPRGREVPEKDPYLVEGTETTETVTVCGYELPPIREGVHRGLGLRGQPQDYNVRIVWVSRRQIDAMLKAIGQQHPELDQALEVVSTFIMHLDTIRDETGLGIAAALGVLRKEKDKHPHALENLETVNRMLGRWDDAARLHLQR